MTFRVEPAASEPAEQAYSELGSTALELGGTNAIGRMLGLLGDEWTLLILQRALLGTVRYRQFLTELPISNAVLTNRLSLLTREGLLERHIYQPHPPRSEYRTTLRSRSLWPIMLAIWAWEITWVPDQAEALPRMQHATCGQDFRPQLCCAACEKSVTTREIHAEWGPSGGWARSVPQASTRRRGDNDANLHRSGMFAETMAILGNRWSCALLGAAFRRLTRFSDFEKALSAPPTIVADRLREFVSIGILMPVHQDAGSSRVEYHLTDKGRAFFPVLANVIHWAERWYVAPEGLALAQQHLSCQKRFAPVLRCDQCTEILTGAAVRIIAVDPASTSANP
ncbi:MAG: helix-turn-helix domain-containing protein [Antricoccus sp.]